ncbi:hypothetical protein [Caulobacter sp. 1776]|uniref:hypothetical protein n=1 Tax=Caulobacter sp. 1776 TaxID=3156420 RepID=UPI0033910DF7
MHGRELGLAIAGLLMLSACAGPHALGQGDVANLKGVVIAAYASQTDGEDAAFAKAVQAQAIDRLGSKAGGKPAYLVQVGVALAPPPVGVSTAAGTLDVKAWRSQPPIPRPWSRKAPVRVVTLIVLDAGTGKTVAWSSLRMRKGEPAAVADLLVQALTPVKG